MRILILIITVIFSGVCFGQDSIKRDSNYYIGTVIDYDERDTFRLMPGEKITGIKSIKDTTKAPNADSILLRKRLDSLNIKVFSTKDVMDYLIRINNKVAALKELDLINDSGYRKLIAEMNKIMGEMDKKRRMK